MVILCRGEEFTVLSGRHCCCNCLFFKLNLSIRTSLSSNVKLIKLYKNRLCCRDPCSKLEISYQRGVLECTILHLAQTTFPCSNKPEFNAWIIFSCSAEEGVLEQRNIYSGSQGPRSHIADLAPSKKVQSPIVKA